MLGPDLWRLQRFQAAVRRCGAEIVWSYVSLTELSEYADGLPRRDEAGPPLPGAPACGKPAFCFYPMSKRRVAEYNWYELGFEERKRAHDRSRRSRKAFPRPGSAARHGIRPDWTTGSGE